MPLTTLSWSTKQVTTMTTLSVKPFFTPPMTRGSFDGNNNPVQFNSERKEKLMSETDTIDRSSISKLSCDNCGLNIRGLVLRWCENCASAICDACVLDGHSGHVITWHQEALRIANRKVNDQVEKINCEMKHLRVKRAETQQYQRDISTKINDVKSKVERREKESWQAVNKMLEQLKEVTEAGKMALNGDTICKRRHVENLSNTVSNSLLNRQDVMVKQLKEIDHAVSKMFDGIFVPAGGEKVTGGDKKNEK